MTTGALERTEKEVESEERAVLHELRMAQQEIGSIFQSPEPKKFAEAAKWIMLAENHSYKLNRASTVLLQHMASRNAGREIKGPPDRLMQFLSPDERKVISATYNLKSKLDELLKPPLRAALEALQKSSKEEFIAKIREAGYVVSTIIALIQNLYGFERQRLGFR